MSGRLWLFSSKIERDAAFPDGVPEGLHTGITGVGLVDAGVMTVELIRQFEPSQIVFLGTCGAYPGSGLKIGDMVAAAAVRLGSGDTVRGEMRIPKLLPAELIASPELTRNVVGSADVRSADVLCTLGVTERDDLAETLATAADVENLEVFSVLRAAGLLPVAAVLGVTNIVGEGGGKDWAANYRSMMRLLAVHAKAQRADARARSQKDEEGT